MQVNKEKIIKYSGVLLWNYWSSFTRIGNSNWLYIWCSCQGSIYERGWACSWWNCG